MLTKISKEKLEDMRWREELLGFVKSLMWKYNETGDKKYLDLAKEAGEESKKVKEFIDHGDYTQRNASRERIDRLIGV